MNNSKFTAALIDSSVIETLEYDFLGINSITLSALYSQIEQKGIKLLNCNALYQKVKSNVCKSALIDELQQLRNYFDGLSILKSLGDEVDKSVNVINGINLQQRFDERFEQLYQNAIDMPSCNVDDVITLYYSKLFPFDNTGEEFTIADAFILSTVMDYANNHADERILVITHSDDWENILERVANVTVFRSAEKVLENWLPNKRFAEHLYKRFKHAIQERIEEILTKRPCVVGNYGDNKPVFSVENVCIEICIPSPLQLKDGVATFNVDVDAEVDGFYKRSYCQYEDDRWFSEDGSCSANFQVEITYETLEYNTAAQLSDVKSIDVGATNVWLRCDDDDY